MDNKEYVRKEGSVHVFKTTLAGNGGLYGWKEIDEKGDTVRESVQTYSSEADAEKAIRTLVSSNDIIEVETVKNINTEANTNVNLIKPEVKDDNFGMTAVPKGVEEIAQEEAAASARKGHSADHKSSKRSGK